MAGKEGIANVLNLGFKVGSNANFFSLFNKLGMNTDDGSELHYTSEDKQALADYLQAERGRQLAEQALKENSSETEYSRSDDAVRYDNSSRLNDDVWEEKSPYEENAEKIAEMQDKLASLQAQIDSINTATFTNPVDTSKGLVGSIASQAQATAQLASSIATAIPQILDRLDKLANPEIARKIFIQNANAIRANVSAGQTNVTVNPKMNFNNLPPLTIANIGKISSSIEEQTAMLASKIEASANSFAVAENASAETISKAINNTRKVELSNEVKLESQALSTISAISAETAQSQKDIASALSDISHYQYLSSDRLNKLDEIAKLNTALVASNENSSRRIENAIKEPITIKDDLKVKFDNENPLYFENSALSKIAEKQEKISDNLGDISLHQADIVRSQEKIADKTEKYIDEIEQKRYDYETETHNYQLLGLKDKSVNLTGREALCVGALSVGMASGEHWQYDITEKPITDLNGDIVAKARPVDMTTQYQATRARTATDENAFEIDESDFDLPDFNPKGNGILWDIADSIETDVDLANTF